MSKLKYWLPIILALPLVASAQSIVPSAPGGLPDLSYGYGAIGLAEYVIGFLLALAGIVCVLFLIIGGYQYITSGGNEELASRGKKTLQNAIIGLIVIILSYTIIVVIARALGV